MQPVVLTQYRICCKFPLGKSVDSTNFLSVLKISTTEKKFEKLTKLMIENPSTLQRTIARWISVSQQIIQRMLSDLNLRPYIIQLMQPLNEDYE